MDVVWINVLVTVRCAKKNCGCTMECVVVGKEACVYIFSVRGLLVVDSAFEWYAWLF